MEFDFPYSAAVKAANDISVSVIYEFIYIFVHGLLLNESIAADFLTLLSTYLESAIYYNYYTLFYYILVSDFKSDASFSILFATNI